MTGPESYSPDDELSAFQKAVNRHPSGILISPAQPDKFKDAIDAAIKDGIPVICVDSDSPASGRILFVGTDNYQAGLESGKRMAQLLHGKGNVVLITIPGQLNLEERLRGVTESFQKFPEIRIFKTFDDKGDPRSANDRMSALLDSKNPRDKFDGIV